MISIGANGERIAYGIKHYNLDTEEDLKNFSKNNKTVGTTCFVISTSKYYMLNSKQELIEITPFGKIISSDGETDDNPSFPPVNDDVIYEGGEI